jgi:hypothetical protein
LKIGFKSKQRNIKYLYGKSGVSADLGVKAGKNEF